MKIFVVHYSKLETRKTHILTQFRQNDIVDFEFVVKYDKEELTAQQKSYFAPNYKPSMMSFMFKTFYIFNEISTKYANALILEDDVILCDHFVEFLNKYLSQLPDDYDMFFIGDGCDLHIPTRKIMPNKHVYPKELQPTSWGGNGASRCTDSYIISNKCARRLCLYINQMREKISLSGDWWLNKAARDNNFKVYWAEPTIVTQGTQTGLFQSSHG
jgi:GR25 family glycosyltransferase involved in LPS biosynthesis